MPVRNAFRLVLIPIAMIMTAPAFAKYTEEWVGGRDDAEAHTTTHVNVHAAASHTSDALQPHAKPKVFSSPFASDPIAAFADDPIAAFARSRSK